MRRLIALFLTLCAVSSLPAFGAEPDLLARLGKQIGQHPVMRTEFTQSKQMSSLKRPLITSGRLVVSDRHGALWQIEQPYRVSYLLGKDRIVEISAEGVRRERGLRDVPGLAQVGNVFRAILGANTAALSELFTIDARGTPTKWEIELKPRQAQLAQFLGKLQLSGGSVIETIRINETNGDSTYIRFRNTEMTDAPNEDEIRLFVEKSAKP